MNDGKNQGEWRWPEKEEIPKFIAIHCNRERHAGLADASPGNHAQPNRDEPDYNAYNHIHECVENLSILK